MAGKFRQYVPYTFLTSTYLFPVLLIDLLPRIREDMSFSGFENLLQSYLPKLESTSSTQGQQTGNSSFPMKNQHQNLQGTKFLPHDFISWR